MGKLRLLIRIVLFCVCLGSTVVTPVWAQSPEPENEPFIITFEELGYGERVLHSPYDNVEYTFVLPQGWELLPGSYLELDFSYFFEAETAEFLQNSFPLLGEISLILDDTTLQTVALRETQLDHIHLLLELPAELINTSSRVRHTLEIVLSAQYHCDLPHYARLTIHPKSFFVFNYAQRPIEPDLSVYPRPFHQQSFQRDEVLFVLPEEPNEFELASALGVAAKLGDLTWRLAISGTTDIDVLDRLETSPFRQHIFAIGTPERNALIALLNDMDVLPVTVQERELQLAIAGPTSAVPGSPAAYTLVLTNTTTRPYANLQLLTDLSPYVRDFDCIPECVETSLAWQVANLAVGESRQFTVNLTHLETLSNTVVGHTFTLLDSESLALNGATITTTITPFAESSTAPVKSVVSPEGFFFVRGMRVIPDGDGIVQELVSPWAQNRAILVLTGLSDVAVTRAAQAMSSETDFPSMQGEYAFVQHVVTSTVQATVPNTATVLTFADLGYDDRFIRGVSGQVSYYFDVPLGWRLSDNTHVDLYIQHSQLIKEASSYVNVLFNGSAIATVPLNDDTAQSGRLHIALPTGQSLSGRTNQLTIQAEMSPLDRCSLESWIMIDKRSQLELEYSINNSYMPDLSIYPYPFHVRDDLSDVLVVLPLVPRPVEWRAALELAMGLGNAAGGNRMMPQARLTDAWSEDLQNATKIIAIGRPTRNVAIQYQNEKLPQPFIPGTDVIEQKLNEIIFRLPPDLDLGYVQLLYLDAQRVMLAITGTTDEGVEQAADIVLERPWELKGNLLLTQDGEAKEIETRELTRDGTAIAVTTAVPEMEKRLASPTPSSTPALTSTPVIERTAMPPDITPDSGARPPWILPFIGGMGLLTFVILAVGLGRYLRQK